VISKVVTTRGFTSSSLPKYIFFISLPPEPLLNSIALGINSQSVEVVNRIRLKSEQQQQPQRKAKST